MEMGTIRTKVSRSHSEIIAFLSLTFSNPNPTYDTDIFASFIREMIYKRRILSHQTCQKKCFMLLRKILVVVSLH